MRNFTKSGFSISKKIGRAIKDYSLIEEGDRILIAVSGGKDSLSLLKLLKERQRWAPVKFELFAAHIQADLLPDAGKQAKILVGIFKDMGLNYKIKRARVKNKKGKSACFWCSWNRRKALFQLAERLDCNKIALAHHKDDIIETMLLNLFFHGEFSIMNPRQDLFKGKVSLIRPLCYVEEYEIKKFARENNLSEDGVRCPNAQTSQRRYLKNLVRQLKRRSPHVKKNIFRSISRINAEYIDLKSEG